MREHGQKTDKLRIKEKRELFGMPRVLRNLLVFFLAEKGGSRTLRGPYDPQTGFEDQRHHRAPSFSSNVFNYLWQARTLFINSFINLRGPEGSSHIVLGHLEVALVTSAPRSSRQYA